MRSTKDSKQQQSRVSFQMKDMKWKRQNQKAPEESFPNAVLERNRSNKEQHKMPNSMKDPKRKISHGRRHTKGLKDQRPAASEATFILTKEVMFGRH